MFTKEEKGNVIALLKAGMKSMDLNSRAIVQVGLLLNKIEQSPEVAEQEAKPAPKAKPEAKEAVEEKVEAVKTKKKK